MSVLLENQGQEVADQLERLVEYVGKELCGDCEFERTQIADFRRAFQDGNHLQAFRGLQAMTLSLRSFIEKFGHEICGDCFKTKDEIRGIEAGICEVLAKAS